jgi:hypothetical protein
VGPWSHLAENECGTRVSLSFSQRTRSHSYWDTGELIPDFPACVAYSCLLQRIRHALRAVRLLARDGRIPRPLRWLAVVGLLPIPGPIDEGVLLIFAGVLWVFYRDCLKDAWSRAA